MDLFQNVLKEALNKNDVEIQKWKKHKEEMEQAEQNMREFQKHLQVKCMIPIGTKALMPGHLYHTSEIIVGHGRKVFSKCKTQGAIKICKHRLKCTENRLAELQAEKDLHKNKLELPFMENAFSQQEQEIIEEYHEEKERIWREEHRKNVSLHKKREAEERNKNLNRPEIEKSDENIFSMLDELELIEELDRELTDMKVTTDEQLKKIMSGEVKLPPEKKRTSYYNEQKDVIVDGTVSPEKPEFDLEDNQENYNLEFSSPAMVQPSSAAEVVTENIIKQQEIKMKPVTSKERPTTSVQQVNSSRDDSPPDEGTFSAESDIESDVDISTISEQVYLQFRKLLEETKNLTKKEKQRILKNQLKAAQVCLKELVVRDVDDLTTKIDLNDLKECIQDEIIRMEDDPNAVSNDEQEEIEIPSMIENQKKSKLKFAKEDQIKLIDKFDAPCKVSLPDLTNDSTQINNLTLQIHFKHTNNEFKIPEKSASDDEGSILSPMDIYKKFVHCLKKSNSFEGPKSILKNKDKVLQENHLPVIVGAIKKKIGTGKKSTKKVKSVKSILGDVIERPVTYENKFVPMVEEIKADTQVSKFKVNRDKNKLL